MKRNKGRLFAILLMVLVAFSLAGCRLGNDKSNQMQSEDNKTNDNQITIELYYVDANRQDYVIEEYNIDQMTTVENMIDNIMGRMIESGESQAAYTPVPEGMSYQRYSYDGHGMVTIVFNMDYENTSVYNQIICKAAFTNTLCQLEAVDCVTFEIVNLINEEVVDETYSSGDFARLKNVLASDCQALIYYPYDDGTRLKVVDTILDMSRKESLEEQIIEKLKDANNSGYACPFAENVTVNYVTTEDGVCTISLNDKFLKGKEGLDNSVIVYSIVNSLLSLDYVNEVHFSIEGSEEPLMGDMDLSIGYRGKYSFTD
ncbi:MAG: GerMN domain-containing protein [Coprococcus sp.]